MKPNTALSFLVLAVSVCLRIRAGADAPGSLGTWVARVGAGLVLLHAGATILAYAFEWQAMWDTWLFGDAVRQEGGEFPGRMSLATAAGISLLGVALLTLDVKVRGSFRLSEFLTVGAMLVSYIALSCYIYDVYALYSIPWFSSLSLPTAMLLTALGCAVVGARPERGIMATINSVNTGGWIARRLLPMAFLLPVTLGWLRLVGERAHWYPAAFGLSLLTTAFAVVFALVVWRHAHLLNQKDEARSRAEEVQSRLAAIVEFSDDAIIGLELDGTVTSWNRGATRLFGYSEEEMVGGPVHRLLTADRKDEDLGILARVKHGDTVDHSETVRRRKDGGLVDISVTVSPIRDAAGRVIGASKVARDITIRKQAEKRQRESEDRFREIAENINEVFWTFDLATQQVLYVSPAYESIWGKPCEDLNAFLESWLEAIHSDDRGRVEASFIARQSTGDYNETYRIMRPDGTFRWIHDRAFPIRNSSGAVYRIIGLAEDITERQVLEQRLSQAQKLEALGTLSGGIAHDFNNILCAIMGYTDLACLTTSDPEVTRLLEPVKQAGQRATGLVRQILSFSRQQEPQRAVVQLQGIAEESLHLLRATLPASIEIDTEFKADLPTVLADATQIHQVLMNLGTNAWHAMQGSPSGRLTVGLDRFEVDAAMAGSSPLLEEGVYVRLSVSDTGMGMDRVTMARIFEPFFTTKVAGEGTGLGLSVVHGIMRSHDGAITVYSHKNEGTTFHLFFPVVAGVQENAGYGDAPLPRHEGCRVLFVDDELPLADLGRKILSGLGYVVESSTDPTRAFEMVRADPSRFDVVVTDMAMPGMSGLDLARALTSVRPDLPVILTSGYTGGLSEEQIRAAGVSELLPKPHTVRSIGMAVHRVLASR